MYPGSLVPFVAHRARDRIQLNTLRRTANTIPAESEPRKRSVKSRANGRSVGTMSGPAGENINKSATNYETQTSPFFSTCFYKGMLAVRPLQQVFLVEVVKCGSHSCSFCGTTGRFVV